MAASLGGIDALVFTGGVGENAPRLRAGAVDRLGFLGLDLEPRANEAAEAGDRVISPDGVDAAVVVVTAREDLEIAREVRTLLAH
jgi:acetate kinase